MDSWCFYSRGQTRRPGDKESKISTRRQGEKEKGRQVLPFPFLPVSLSPCPPTSPCLPKVTPSSKSVTSSVSLVVSLRLTISISLFNGARSLAFSVPTARARPLHFACCAAFCLPPAVPCEWRV